MAPGGFWVSKLQTQEKKNHGTNTHGCLTHLRGTPCEGVDRVGGGGSKAVVEGGGSGFHASRDDHDDGDDDGQRRDAMREGGVRRADNTTQTKHRSTPLAKP